MAYYSSLWLPHLKGALSPTVGINGVSMYTIALEGWRRGLKLKFYSRYYYKNTKITYSLSDRTKTHYFDDSSGDLNSEKAGYICGNKDLTNKYLTKENIPIPTGKKFVEGDSIEDICEYGLGLGFPLVVKPTEGLAGRGVIANITTSSALRDAISHVQNDLGYNELIVQRFIQGEEVRIYVLNDKVIGAANRKPAQVVGDGISTISELIKQKNEFRTQTLHLRYRLIRIDKEVRKSLVKNSYTLDSVLAQDKVLLLREISNISQGGDPIDYTEQLTQQQKKIAIKATKSIPGLIQCGVDMMIELESKEGYIIELNSSPGIGSHLFPLEGKARDIPKEIIDYYFPKSSPIQTKASYDLQAIFNYLNSGLVEKLEVSSPLEEGSRFTDKKLRHIIELEDEARYNYIAYKPMENELKRLKKRIELTKNSLSWKITSPLRKLLKRNKE